MVRPLIAAGLLPLSWLYCALAQRRRRAVHAGRVTPIAVGVPVVVVGNITVGGTGKTPVVIALAEVLTRAGYRVGLVSRGYGGRGRGVQWVTADSDPAEVGDEAVLLARRTRCAMAVCRRRPDAAARLVAHGCTVIVSDDGLQHYRLARDIELCVVDGAWGLGNRRCLPLGPLREPVERLGAVDRILVKRAGPDECECPLEAAIDHPVDFWLSGNVAVNLRSPARRRPVRAFADQPVHAVAGIGRPEGFFEALRRQGLTVLPHPQADHQVYRAGTLAFADGRPVLMTEKDAVKYRRYATEAHWVVPVEVVWRDDPGAWLLERLASLGPPPAGRA